MKSEKIWYIESLLRNKNIVSKNLKEIKGTKKSRLDSAGEKIVKCGDKKRNFVSFRQKE